MGAHYQLLPESTYIPLRACEHMCAFYVCYFALLQVALHVTFITTYRRTLKLDVVDAVAANEWYG